MMARFTGLLVLFVAAALAAAWLVSSDKSPELATGYVLDTPKPIAEFELIDHRQQAFTRSDLAGRWSLVFIGFTHCPDVCPTTLALLDQLNTQLREGGHDLQTVFVSVDPERDTPEVLARYTGFFSDRIVAATGAREQLGRLCDDLGFAWVKVPGAGGEYTVDHSGALALIDDHARLVGYFTPPFELQGMHDDLASLLK